MEPLTDEIQRISNRINVIEQLLEKDYEVWTRKEINQFGNHEQLREQLTRKQELLIR